MLHALATVVTSTTIAVTASHMTTAQQAATAQQATKAVAKPQFAFHEIETKLISATNQTRARYGLPPLEIDYRLMRSARRHAAWMVRSRNLQHTSAMVAENIAMGQRSVRGALNSWMSSPGHRANILNGSYRRVGVAAYRTPEGTIYWCQQFTW